MSKKYSLGLIGYPVSHSLSPKLHHAALEAAGLEGEYRLYPIASDETGVVKELRELLGRVRGGEVQGLNVTIPHKQTVIPYLDELTPTAQAIGAVNTIYRSADFNRLIGDNTDAPGFLADLHQFFGSVQFSVFRKEALILGAGGSTRAVVYALLQDGWHITLAARRPEQAESLKAGIEEQESKIENRRSRIDICPMPIRVEDVRSSIFDLLLNTTPLGMTPNTEASPWPPTLPFPKHAAVYDLVYNPRETKLVRDARAAGLPATTGLGMLIEQAALAFKIWTGIGGMGNVMRKALEG